MLLKDDNWSLAIYLTLVLIVVLVMLASYFLGERHKERATGEVFESGIKSKEHSFSGFSVSFYLFSMFFVIFDIETIFLVTYALVAKNLGVLGLIHLFIFVSFLLLALFYLYRVGAFFIEGSKSGQR